jgi:4-amino-4-deoxy-L-arabinose transferase-like glycosyltransferase
MRRANFWTLLIMLAIVLLAAGLRFYRLDAQSLWNDEGTSAALALRDLGTIARNAADDIHPPLYYWLLALWVRLFGTSEFALRSLSALLGVGVVALTMRLAQRWFNTQTALLVGLLAAAAPLAVYYAQEARMYMPVTFFGLAAILALTRVLPVGAEPRSLRPGPLLGYGLATLAMLYTHYYGATLLLAHNLAFLVWLALRRELRRTAWRHLGLWALTQLTILACYAPWLAYAWHTIRHWPSISAPFTLAELILRLAQALPLGITVPTTRWTLAIGVSLAALAAVGLARPAREHAEGRTSWWPAIATGLYAAVPLGLMYAASLRRPMYNPKFLLLATPGYLLLLARGIEVLADVAARRGGHWLGRVTLALAALATLVPMSWSLSQLYSNPAYARDDYRGIVAYISAVAGPRDALLVNAPAQVETVEYYYDGAWPVYPLPRSRPADRAATEAELAALLTQHERLYGIVWATDESDPEGIIEGYLDRHAFKTLDAWHGNVRLVVYTSARQAPAEPSVPSSYRLGEDIVLDGYALLTPEPTPGDAVQVTLFWRAERALAERLKVFVHLVDAHGHIVGQHDGEPAGGSQPTDSWAPGEMVRDNHGILVQPGTPPGPLTLRVGLYDPVTSARLPVAIGASSAGSAVPGDAIDLATVALAAPATPLPIEAFDVETRVERRLDGTQVLGYSLYPLGLRHESRRTLRPGEAAELVLYTRSTASTDAPLQVSLERRDVPLAAITLADISAGLPDEHIARTVQQLAIPADAAPGRYRLTIRDAAGQAVLLGTITVSP